jgi:hypothetical protein
MTRFSQPGTGPRPYIDILVPVVGFLFCGAVQMNVLEEFCAGDGCSVYQGFNLLGIPFYTLGMALFFLILCARLYGKKQEWHKRISLLALFLDGPFLLWQMVFFPCSNCLVVALLLIINASLTMRRERRFETGRAGSPLIIVLVVLVLVNAINIVRQDIKPWGITPRSSASYLFFSPSCEQCREHISLMNGTGHRSAPQLVPVSLSDEDDHRIFAMSMAIEDGLPPGKALLAAMTGKYHTASLPQWLRLQLRLHWNRAVLGMSGGKGLPWFTVPGVEGVQFAEESTPGLCTPSTGCE